MPDIVVFGLSNDREFLKESDWWRRVFLVDRACVMYLPVGFFGDPGEVVQKMKASNIEPVDYKSIQFAPIDFIQSNYGHVLLAKIIISTFVEFATKHKDGILKALEITN